MFKSTVLLAVFAGLFSAQGALAAGHVIEHAGDKPSVVGSAKIFTGKVRQDPIASADQYSHNGITVVTFEPGARTFWHSHPAGQRLLIVSGKGFVGTADDVTHVVRAGDYVWCPPEIEHWHGATPDTAMSHILHRHHAIRGRLIGCLCTYLTQYLFFACFLAGLCSSPGFGGFSDPVW